MWYFHVLKQRFANFLCRKPDREYFRLCEPQDLCCDDSFLLLWRESSIDNTLNLKEFQPCVGDLKKELFSWDIGLETSENFSGDAEFSS